MESLKVFCDLIETRSFSQAAARNSISQSAVSQQIRTLEDRYGRRLIERSRRGLEPTPAGVTFYQGCREILEQYAALADEMTGAGKTVRGDVRIATIYSVGLYDLPPIVKKSIKTLPDVNIHIEYSRTAKIYEDLIAGTIDFGIVAYPVPRPQVDSIPFRSDALVMICSPEHELASIRKIPIKRLAGQRFTGFERNIPTRRAIDEMLREHGVVVEYVMEFDNIETIKRSVEVDQGIAIVPRVIVENEVRAGTLCAVELVPKLTRTVSIVHRKGKVFSAAARRVLELLVGEKPARKD